MFESWSLFRKKNQNKKIQSFLTSETSKKTTQIYIFLFKISNNVEEKEKI